MQELKHLITERNIKLKGADVLSTSGFTQVPNAILRAPKLSPGAKLTYAMLLSYAWHDDYCYPGQGRLAEDMGVSDRSVRTYLRELEEGRFLTVQQQGQGKTNLYELDLTVKLGKR